MLRIHITELADLVVLRLEGKLSGAWVKELERVWEGFRSNPEARIIRVDLSDVTFVDERGKGLLAWMTRKGARLDATGPLMNSVVDEIHDRVDHKLSAAESHR
jgi:anti-anti-sigma regulatory factor